MLVLTGEAGPEGAFPRAEAIDFMFDAKAIDGVFVVSLAPGAAPAVEVDLVFTRGSLVADIDASITADALELDGFVEAVVDGQDLTLEVVGLAYLYGDCHPNAGAIHVTSEEVAVEFTVLFDEGSTDSGEVTIEIGRLGFPTRCPARTAARSRSSPSERASSSGGSVPERAPPHDVARRRGGARSRHVTSYSAGA